MTRLPVVSTATQTKFCAATIQTPVGPLHFDGNAKITAGNGSFEDPKPNAFSLPSRGVEAATGDPGPHCPEATPTCLASCYVAGLAAAQSELYQLYRENYTTVEAAIAGPQLGYVALTMASWINQNAPGGFRWHVSGDLYSCEYALLVSQVVKLSPTVNHWIYTRSFWLTAAFVGLRNMSVNYSVDRDNYEHALKYYEAHRNANSPVRLCYLATGDGKVPELPKGSVIFPDYNLRGSTSDWFAELPPQQKQMVCPVDLHGKSERRRCGPCDRCLKSVDL